MTEFDKIQKFCELIRNIDSKENLVTGIERIFKDADFKETDFENLHPLLIQVWSYFKENRLTPRLIFAGKTGVGKSSVINALLKDNYCEVGVTPQTRDQAEYLWTEEDENFVIVDAPGFSEAEKEDEEYDEKIQALARSKGHILVLVFKADDRALKDEADFLRRWNHANENQIPVFIIINQIEKVSPNRDWNPAELNLKALENERSEKEKNIIKYLDYVSSVEDFKNLKLVPFNAGEHALDVDSQYGVSDLVQTIHRYLPEGAKADFLRRISKEEKARKKHRQLLNDEGSKIIKKYSGFAFTAAVGNISPVPNAFILTPLQIMMVVELGRLYNQEMSAALAKGIVAAAAATVVGRAVVAGIVGIIPILKQVVGAPMAASLTYIIGHTALKLLDEGTLNLSAEEIEDIAKEFSSDAQEFSRSLEK